jgi:hypothetical protein
MALIGWENEPREQQKDACRQRYWANVPQLLPRGQEGFLGLA